MNQKDIFCTQHEKNQQLIEQQLLAGKRISVISVLKSIQTLELRHYIAKLRRVHSIAGEWVTTPNGKRYKEYYLTKSD